MAGPTGAGSYRAYWLAWFVLLLLTVLMLLVDQSPLPRTVLVGVMLLAMLVKASMIGGTFMHLRFERLALTLMVVIGLLVNGAILFLLILPDAYRILGMSAP